MSEHLERAIATIASANARLDAAVAELRPKSPLEIPAPPGKAIGLFAGVLAELLSGVNQLVAEAQIQDQRLERLEQFARRIAEPAGESEIREAGSEDEDS